MKVYGLPMYGVRESVSVLFEVVSHKDENAQPESSENARRVPRFGTELFVRFVVRCFLLLINGEPLIKQVADVAIPCLLLCGSKSRDFDTPHSV